MNQHPIMAALLFAIAACLVLIGWFAAPLLRKMGVRRYARYSFLLMTSMLGAYMAWIGSLFWRDKLGPENYSASLWAIRLSVLASEIVFLWELHRCRDQWDR